MPKDEITKITVTWDKEKFEDVQYALHASAFRLRNLELAKLADEFRDLIINNSQDATRKAHGSAAKCILRGRTPMPKDEITKITVTWDKAKFEKVGKLADLQAIILIDEDIFELVNEFADLIRNNSQDATRKAHGSAGCAE